jgi:hypothetical protein
VWQVLWRRQPSHTLPRALIWTQLRLFGILLSNDYVVKSSILTRSLSKLYKRSGAKLQWRRCESGFPRCLGDARALLKTVASPSRLHCGNPVVYSINWLISEPLKILVQMARASGILTCTGGWSGQLTNRPWDKEEKSCVQLPHYNLRRVWTSPKSTSVFWTAVAGLTWLEPWALSTLMSQPDHAQGSSSGYLENWLHFQII